jgi:hypothetical protein
MKLPIVSNNVGNCFCCVTMDFDLWNRGTHLDTSIRDTVLRTVSFVH